jgi:hypothetical protein
VSGRADAHGGGGGGGGGAPEKVQTPGEGGAGQAGREALVERAHALGAADSQKGVDGPAVVRAAVLALVDAVLDCDVRRRDTSVGGGAAHACPLPTAVPCRRVLTTSRGCSTIVDRAPAVRPAAIWSSAAAAKKDRRRRGSTAAAAAAEAAVAAMMISRVRCAFHNGPAYGCCCWTRRRGTMFGTAPRFVGDGAWQAPPLRHTQRRHGMACVLMLRGVWQRRRRCGARR